MKTALALALLSAPVWAQLPPLAATQRLMFENDFVRVSELRMAPGDREPDHLHAQGVTVALGLYDNEVLALPGRTTSQRHTGFGEVRWAEPARHETRNTGTTQQRVIRVELKQEPGAPATMDALDSLIAAKDTQKLVLENAYVRVIEERVPPGVAQPRHRHRKGILIPLADSDLEVVDDPGTAVVRRQLKFGDAGWRDASLHAVKNAGKNELRNIRIEVK